MTRNVSYLLLLNSFQDDAAVKLFVRKHQVSAFAFNNETAKNWRLKKNLEKKSLIQEYK